MSEAMRIIVCSQAHGCAFGNSLVHAVVNLIEVDIRRCVVGHRIFGKDVLEIVVEQCVFV